MVKTVMMIIAVFVVPGVIMGTISSYRAGQRPHRDLYRQLQKFTHRKNKR
jgi:hypothetical protein